MKPIETLNILLNENAYFYNITGNITKNKLLSIFREARNDKGASRTYNTIIRQPLYDGNNAVAKFSLDIFDFKQKPTFFKESQDFWEIKTAYLALLEYGDHIVVFRKNISGIKTLWGITEPIDYELLANFIANENSKFEKIVSSSTNTAENAIQSKTAEATDLKGVMTRFGASKQVISTLRIDNDGIKSSISLNTSRVNALRIRKDLEEVMYWGIAVCDLLNHAEINKKSHSFIKNFARPINFETEIKNLTPVFLLFRFNDLLEKKERGLIDRAYRKTDDQELDVDLIEEITSLRSLFTLTESGPDQYFSDEGVKIKINKKSITVQCEGFDNLFLQTQENDQKFTNYLNLTNNFLITFQQPHYAYTHRKLFKDHRLLDDLEGFLEYFIPNEKLEDVTSEKGTGYTPESESFANNSIFGMVDEMLIDKKCVICDDLGVEWADFISIHDNEIAFYHCKYNNNALSASYLQDVFGQVLKNLGNLEINEEMVEKRRERWAGTYLGLANTNIKRIRRSEDPEDDIGSLKKSLERASLSGNLNRKVYAVVNFLSKDDLSISLEAVKKGNLFEHAGVTLQILWFVNAVLSSANEHSVEFRIICRP